MTPINIIADGKIVGHVEETINVLMGCPSWEWTCNRGGSGCMPTKNQAVAEVLLPYKRGTLTRALTPR